MTQLPDYQITQFLQCLSQVLPPSAVCKIWPFSSVMMPCSSSENVTATTVCETSPLPVLMGIRTEFFPSSVIRNSEPCVPPAHTLEPRLQKARKLTGEGMFTSRQVLPSSLDCCSLPPRILHCIGVGLAVASFAVPAISASDWSLASTEKFDDAADGELASD